MTGRKKENNPSHSGTGGPDSEPARDADGMSHDWLARLRESDSGWNEPAFPDRFARSDGQTAASLSEQAAVEETSYSEDSGRGFVRLAGLGLVALAAIGWIALVAASGVDPDIALRLAPLVNLVAVLAAPLVLLGGLAAWLARPRRDQGMNPAMLAGARDTVGQAERAAIRLGEAQALFMNQTRDFAAMADQSAGAILGTVQAMSAQTAQIEQSTGASIATLTDLSERIATMSEALPRLEDRLATLGETLARTSGEIGHRHDSLDQQLQSTALVAEEVRLQLLDAGKALGDQLADLREGTRTAGEELAGLSELSSARIDLTLDRVKGVLASTQERIEAQNVALAALVEESRASIDRAAGNAHERFAEHCRKIETILDALDARIMGQAEKSNAWLESTARGVTELAGEFNALEQSAMARTERLSSTMMQLSGDTRRLVDAIEDGHGSSEQLVRRAEALLVALDSGVRELDESLPTAMGRVETRLGALHDRIRDANPAIEAVEAVATGVVSQLRESDDLAKGHAAALGEALQRSQQALAAQKAEVAALAQAVGEASDSMARLGESVGPQMIEALLRVRETADAAANRARAAIAEAIPAAAAELGAASGEAMDKAVGQVVTDHLARLTSVADEAVKAAHRATDKLTRQMLTLTDASQTLERTIAGNAERIEGQDRELMAERSARLIASLNERAIDVNKWLDKDVSEADWTAYLKGDQGLFARRATRLVSSADAKYVHALYNEDADFREHVNRYIHDFEALLRTVMATRDGSTLALTMVSSDIGKLYVALAQAIERLRAH
ncbi:hypothetical protein SLG_21000 [Sphingobium sp. SYK-6]|nr:hypothetical protein SLG_21000 [Sphingobium sp. SYK-6]